MKTKIKPLWAKALNSRDWKHLQEGQASKTPRLRNLRTDATTCAECKAILSKIS